MLIVLALFTLMATGLFRLSSEEEPKGQTNGSSQTLPAQVPSKSVK